MRWLGLPSHRKVSKVPIVPDSEVPLPLQNVIRLLELSDSDRGANVRHAVVVTDSVVPVLLHRRDGLGLEMISFLDDFVVVADHHAALAGCDRFISEKAEGRHVAKSPDMLAPILGPEGLGAVLNKQQSTIGADFGNSIHIAGGTVKMHDHHSTRARSDCPFYSRRIDLPGTHDRIDKNRRCAALNNAVHRSDIGQCRYDDLVARPKSDRQQCEMERHGAVAYCRCMPDPNKIGKPAFELANKLASR